MPTGAENLSPTRDTVHTKKAAPATLATSRGLDDTYEGGDAMAQSIADSGFDRMGSHH